MVLVTTYSSLVFLVLPFCWYTNFWFNLMNSSINWINFVLQVQRPEIEPIIYRDLFLFRTLASFLNGISLQKLGCNAELIVDEFGEKLLEELDYTLVWLSALTFFRNILLLFVSRLIHIHTHILFCMYVHPNTHWQISLLICVTLKIVAL